MAKQVGIFPIQGALENVSFYKSEEGFMVRKKGGVSKERIMSDPAYVRTRENINQFGLNAKAGKIIRNAIPSLLKKGKDPRVSSRLSKVMGDIAKQDHVSPRGQVAQFHLCLGHDGRRSRRVRRAQHRGHGCSPRD